LSDLGEIDYEKHSHIVIESFWVSWN